MTGRVPHGAAWLLAVCALLHTCSSLQQGYDPEAGAARIPNPRAQLPGAGGPPRPGVAVRPPGQISRAFRRYQTFVNGAAKVSRWIHVGSGFFVIVSTPVSLISSGIALRPAEMALCGYLGMFGAMLAGCELPLARGLFETYFRFLYTTQGRMLFMIFLAVVAWSCKYVGVLTKALLAFNALLSAYVYNSKALHSFGGEDTRVQGEVGDAVSKFREGLGEVQSFTRMFGFSKALGSGSKRPPPPPPSAYDDGGYGQPVGGASYGPKAGASYVPKAGAGYGPKEEPEDLDDVWGGGR